jgi:methyltransferase (TIGR00027 family)
MAKNTIDHISDTAIWMASYRAIESERADALFRDPLAKVLIGDRGAAITQLMKKFAPYAYWSLVMRTCVIDSYLNESISGGYRTVINLGAGLDTRPYRLDLPNDVLWIEIDFPDVIQMKNEALKNETPKCRLERIGLDLSDRAEREKVFAELNERVSPALILTEGVIPYLSEEMVAELASDLHDYSKFRLWITEYYSPHLYARFQADSFQNRLGNSPFRFFPLEWFPFFESNGWRKKEMRYLFDEGEKKKREFPLPWWVKILKRIFGAEKLAPRLRLQAYSILEKV